MNNKKYKQVYITDDEYRGILSKVPTLKDRLLIELIWNTGIKPHEIRTISYEKMNYIPGEGYVINLKTRKIFITTRWANEFEGYVNNNRLDSDARIWLYTYNKLDYLIKVSAERSGMSRERAKKLTTSALRHNYVFRLFKEGKTVKEVAKILGYKNVQTVIDIYIKKFGVDADYDL